MRLSIDGGALCGDVFARFGNFIFAENLIHGLSLYDNSNTYIVYTFSAVGEKGKSIDYRILRPRTLWSSVRISIEEIKERKDIYLALNQSLPLFTPAKIFSFSHGLSFYFFPKLYPNSYHSMKRQMKIFARKSHKIITSSIKTRNELVSIYPDCIDRVEVLPYGIPFDFIEYKKEKREHFFLFVGMNHSIKNIPFLLHAFRVFKQDRRFQDYKLYLFGDFTRGIEDEDVRIYSKKSRNALKKLYRKATAYVTASLYESFNLPILEALSQECPVVALRSAVIPELEKYVNVANNLDDFVFSMKKAATASLRSRDRQALKEEFSWKDYIRKLVALYS